MVGGAEGHEGVGAGLALVPTGLVARGGVAGWRVLGEGEAQGERCGCGCEGEAQWEGWE